MYHKSSHPAWGGGIEMDGKMSVVVALAWSHPAWGGWIEIFSRQRPCSLLESHPAWGGWIEIVEVKSFGGADYVPPRMGWVD